MGKPTTAAASQPAMTAAKLLKMPASAYMNEVQLDFFRALLLDLKRQTSDHIETIKQEIASPATEADELDRALLEEENRQRMRIAEREYYLLRKIDKALDRIERGEYGYCEVTGEPISLARLEARPIATMTLEAQEKHERIERVSRDD